MLIAHPRAEVTTLAEVRVDVEPLLLDVNRRATQHPNTERALRACILVDGEVVGWGWFCLRQQIPKELLSDNKIAYDRTPFAVVWASEEWPGGVVGQVVDLGEPNSIPTLDFSCVADRSQWSTWGDAICELSFYEPNDTWVSYDEFIIYQNDDVIDDWTAFSHTFTVPPTAGKVDMQFSQACFLSGRGDMGQVHLTIPEFF